MHHDDLKRRHELAVAQDFVAFLRQEGLHLGAVRSGERANDGPDAVCDSRTASVGIEVADGYAGDAAAKDLWDRARAREATPTASGSIGVFGAQEKILVDQLKRTWQVHSAHKYSVPTYLVLNIVHDWGPHEYGIDTRDLPSIRRGLIPPPACGFRAVYLRLTDSASGRPTFVLLRCAREEDR